MSEISNLTTALNKMKAAMKDILSAVDKESNNLSDGVNAISDLAKHFESRVKDRSKFEEEKSKKTIQIEKEIAELEKRKSLVESTYAEKTSNTDDINKVEDLKGKLASMKEECTVAAKEVNELERSVNDKKRETDKLKSDLQSAKRKHDSDIRSLRESHDEVQSNLAWKEAQHKALRLLKNEKAATFPEYKVIEVLREQSSTTMDHLQTTTQLKRNDIESILKKLAKKAVIQYDPKAGEVRVLRHLED
jgi:chromosome segregation ATPase